MLTVRTNEVDRGRQVVENCCKKARFGQGGSFRQLVCGVQRYVIERCYKFRINPFISSNGGRHIPLQGFGVTGSSTVGPLVALVVREIPLRGLGAVTTRFIGFLTGARISLGDFAFA